MPNYGNVELEPSSREPQESTDGAKPVENRTDRGGFEAFLAAIDEEIKWIGTIHSGDKTGQAASDQATLRRLADEVRRVGGRLGYL
jgi:hypothetical protein